jgi:hypothetical protein
MLMRKTEGKSQLGRHMFRWEDNVKFYLKENVRTI